MDEKDYEVEQQIDEILKLGKSNAIKNLFVDAEWVPVLVP